MILLITRISFFIFFNNEPWVLNASQDDFLAMGTLHSGPLSNLLFAGLAGINSELLDATLCGLLVLLNAIQLNSIFIRNASFQDSSYLPAALYVILMSASADFYHLGPELIGSSFLLIALNYLFYHIKYRGTEENILGTGLTVGLAGLCYYPFLWFYLVIIIIYLQYSGTITRRYFLVTWGFVLPFLITWLIFFVFDQGTNFLNSLFSEAINNQVLGELLNNSLLVYGLALALSFIAAIQNFSGQGMTNHQILVQKSMSWVGFFGVIIFAIFSKERMATLAIVIPVMAYFNSKMLVNISKKTLAELAFICVFGVAIAALALGY